MTRDLTEQEPDLNRAKTTSNWLLAALAMLVTETVSILLASVLPRGVKVTMLLDGIIMPLLVLKIWGRRVRERAYWASALLMSIAAYIVTKKVQEVTGSDPHAAVLSMIAAPAGLLVFDRLPYRRPCRTVESVERNRGIDLAIFGSLASIAIQWLIHDEPHCSPLHVSRIPLFYAAALIVYLQTKVCFQNHLSA